MIINAATQASKTLDRQRDVDDAGEAFSLSKKMSVFDQPAIAKMNDMATLRGYKANGLFNNKIFNTTPSFPKVHNSHGESLENQPLS